MKQNKKGFTVVELIIVIAIIAILAAVLIPTFANIIKYSNESKDTQLIRNLNTALRIDKPDGKHATMHEALQAAYDAGYDIGKINNTAVQENKILWDSKNDVFCYFDSQSTNSSKIAYVPEFPMTEKPADVDYFVISKELDDMYSTYLYNYTGEKTLNVTKGLDVGDEEIDEVVYTNDSGSVVIRTNGGSVKVVNGNVVNHYGYAESVEITKVAADSYHEYGKVGYLTIAEGHLVVEAGAEVTVLLGSGAPDKITVDNNGAEIGKAYTSVQESEGTAHEGNLSLAYYAGSTASLEAGATLFAGGTGTAADPFLIVDYDTMQNISQLYENETIHFFKVKDGINTIDCQENGRSWVSVNLLGSFDGNGVTFLNVNKPLFSRINNIGTDYATNGIIVKDFTIKANIVTSNATALAYYLINSTNLHLTFDSINVEGYIEGSGGAASFIFYGPNSKTNSSLANPSVIFKNCISTATVVATGDFASGFVKHGFGTYYKIEDSLFLGTLSDTKTCSGYFNGNSTKQFHATVSYSSGFLTSHGIENDTELYTYPTSGSLDSVDADINNWKAVSRTTLVKTSQALPENAQYGDLIAINKTTNASKAIVTLWIAPNDTNNTGSYLSCYMSEEIDLSSGESFTTSSIRYFDIEINGSTSVSIKTSGNSGYSSDGKVFNVLNSYYGHTHNGAYVQIVQYSGNGAILSIQTVAIEAAN